MKYRYGNFFGVTAVHLMYMHESDIEDLFQLTHIKASSFILLENLYTEVLALKAIFAPEATVGLPHVIMRRDNKNQAVKDIVAGFNYYLEMRSHQNSKETVESEISSEDFSDLDQLDLSGNETSFFSDSNLSDLKTPPLSNAGIDTNNLEHLFDDSDDTLEELDFDNLLSNDSLDVSSILSDLVSAGSKYQASVITVPNILRMQTYLASHKDEFTSDEYNSIIGQLNSLPKEPVTVEVPDHFKEHVDGISESSLRILTSLYQHMMRPAVLHGTRLGMSFVDYVSDKLQLILSSKVDSVKRLFFTAQSDFSRDLSENQINNFILDLNNVYLCQDHVSIVLSNIAVLLDDCEETLGLKNDMTEQQNLNIIKSQIAEYYNNSDVYSDSEAFEVEDSIASNLISLLSLSFTSESREKSVRRFFCDLLRSEKLLPLLGNLDNLRIVMKIDDSLQNVIISEFYGKLNADKIQEDAIPSFDRIVSICTPAFIKFVKETGILGFTCDYNAKLKRTLNEITTPLEAKVNTVFSKDSENYRMSHLLRKHLKSLQKRLEKYDRR